MSRKLFIIIIFFIASCSSLNIKNFKKYTNISLSEFIEKRICTDIYDNSLKSKTDKFFYYLYKTQTKEKRLWLEERTKSFKEKGFDVKYQNGCNKKYHFNSMNYSQLLKPYREINLFCKTKGGILELKENSSTQLAKKYWVNPYTIAQGAYKNSKNTKHKIEILPDISMNLYHSREEKAIEAFKDSINHNKITSKQAEPINIARNQGYFGKYDCVDKKNNKIIFKVLINPIKYWLENMKMMNNSLLGNIRILIKEIK